MNVDVILSIIIFVIFIALLPVIKWLALVALIIFAVLVVKVIFDSKEVKKDIQNNPDKYYNSKIDKDGK